MKHQHRIGVAALGGSLALGLAQAVGADAAASPDAAGRCERLSAATISGSTIKLATAVTSGTFQPPTGDAITELPAFCRVVVEMRHSADSNVGVEVWLPLSGWNGRYLGTGNGGYAGQINYRSGGGPMANLAEGVNLGYAVANTDMGTGRPTGSEGASHLVGHPVRWLDFGHRSTHGMTTAAKQLIRSFYGRPAQYSYFNGCSTGGMQGLREAQQYPDDYDGVLVGAPGNNRARIHVSILWSYAVAKRKPSRTLTDYALQLIDRTVLSACATSHGGGLPATFIDDPQRCRWRPETLLCKGAETQGCLTADQVEAANMLYGGPKNPRTGEQIFPGLPHGTELGWKAYMAEPNNPEMPYAGVFRWVFGPDWQWNKFDYDRDAATFEEVLTPFFVATDADLGRFKARGGRLLMYYGWADWLSSAHDGIDYYHKVVQKMRPRGIDGDAALRSTQEFFRLFMMPGVGHCRGGPGADQFDGIGTLVRWVEKGVAPDRIVAARSVDGEVQFTRPLCPHPQVARYKGTGDIHQARSFECAK